MQDEPQTTYALFPESRKGELESMLREYKAKIRSP
jgi:hypothetical protein